MAVVLVSGLARGWRGKTFCTVGMESCLRPSALRSKFLNISRVRDNPNKQVSTGDVDKTIPKKINTAVAPNFPVQILQHRPKIAHLQCS